MNLNFIVGFLFCFFLFYDRIKKIKGNLYQ